MPYSSFDMRNNEMPFQYRIHEQLWHVHMTNRLCGWPMFIFYTQSEEYEDTFFKTIL